MFTSKVAALIETSFDFEEDSRPRRLLPAPPSTSEPPSLAALYESGGLEFSAREPAINLYADGGDFNRHTDRQTLTVLLYLTPPEAFEGGGTGFWAQGRSRSIGNNRCCPQSFRVFSSSKDHSSNLVCRGQNIEML